MMADPRQVLHIKRLDDYLATIPRIREQRFTIADADFQSWQEGVKHSLAEVFGPESAYTERFKDLLFWVPRTAFGKSTWAPIDQAKFDQDLAKSEKILTDALEEIAATVPSHPGAPNSDSGNSVKVFLVHGQDREARETVARFLERLGLDVVILHEQANAGRTVIEKLEHHAAVSFAVVLLTPDDVGAIATDPSHLQFRARQNVLLELGYFAGRLGRDRVCALHRGDLELPSDVLGILYVSFDDVGGWKLLLARELKAAGLPVNLNDAV